MSTAPRHTAPTLVMVACLGALSCLGALLACTPSANDPANDLNARDGQQGFDSMLDRDADRTRDGGANGDPETKNPNTPGTDAGISDGGPATPEEPSDSELCLLGPNKGLPASGNVYYGTDTPDYLTTMTAGQMMAIGTFGSCTGTIINDQWVLSAEHCDINTNSEFCVGAQPGNPNICFQIVQAVNEPGGNDLALARLDVPYFERAPNLRPIPILLTDLTADYIGRTAEAAGYGQQEDGASGRREFTDQVISDLDDDKISIDGQGLSGVCFGDSGGPVMVYDDAGDIRVAGALSYGDPSCVGVDRFTRVDLYRSWLIGLSGPPPATGPVPCGTVSSLGGCNNSNTAATYCGSNDLLVVDTCSGSEVCGFDQVNSGWRCLELAADPCAGVGTFGACDDGVLSWCTGSGEPQLRDCGGCGESCRLIDDSFGYGCKVSACGDISYEGECQGDTAVWCNGSEELQSQDCSATNKVCGYHSEEFGFWCIDPPSENDCGDVDYLGQCDGDTAVWCSNSGELRSQDCTADGETCGYVNDSLGYFCE